MKKHLRFASVSFTLIAIIAATLLPCAFNVSAQVAQGGSYSLDQSVIAGGGGQGSAGGNFGLDGTIGQSAAGTQMIGGQYAQYGGFWTPSNVVPTAAGIFIAGNIITVDGAPLGGVVVVLSGAANAVTITNAKGEYRFDDLDPNQLYLVTPSRANYSFAPFNYTFSLIGNRADAVFTALAGAPTANPLDTPEFFVRQQYLDFLDREPDAAGFKFWSDRLNAQLAACKADTSCREDALARVSAALFLSVEFQKTGATIYRAYRASFNRAPRLAEFLPDAASIGNGVIVNQSNWQDQLAANTKSFFEALTSRSAFHQLYPENLSSVELVDALNANVGAVLTFEERAALIADLDAGRKTRAEVLQQITENQTFVKREFNRAFVLMEYFGYLRRNPDDAPDGNSDGYNFWLKKLDQFGGDYQAAQMVKAFITSNEYRARFK